MYTLNFLEILLLIILGLLLSLFCYLVVEYFQRQPTQRPEQVVTPHREPNEQRIDRIDHLFDIGLVLLGILSAAEFQYFLTGEDKALYFYALRVYTIPFIVLIGFWLAKELVGILLNSPALRMLLSDFCWDFWSFTLLYYLLGIYGGVQMGIIFSFILSMVLIAAVQMAYSKVSPVTSGDRSMFKYYRSPLWIAIKLIVFVLAYFLLLGIVLPYEIL